MSKLKSVLFAGAALALVGAVAARAQSPDVHVLNVQLPDGGVAHIQYAGDVPPQVVLVPDTAPAALVVPFPNFGPNSPFAALDRMAAEMDRETAALMRQVQAMTAHSFGSDRTIQLATGGAVPAGVCMQSLQVSYAGPGTQPQVVSRTEGNCGRPDNSAHPLAASPAPATQPPRTVEIDDGAAPVPSGQGGALWHHT